MSHAGSLDDGSGVVGGGESARRVNCRRAVVGLRHRDGRGDILA